MVEVPESRQEDGVVTIVSGLPRSGTSLMMQMLAAGGMPVLTDNLRQADADNPQGYFEYEPVKHTKDDPLWLGQAGGRAVKMVHLLLYDLPADYTYRVILMKRSLTEVVSSQSLMLKRLGRSGANLTEKELIAACEGQFRRVEVWLAEQPNFASLGVDYNDLLRQPGPTAETINAFVGGGLSVEKMCGVIDPELYRQRS